MADKKIIAISGGNERKIHFIKQILAYTGRNAFAITSAETVQKQAKPASVLLTEEPEKFSGSPFFPVCVTCFRSEKQKTELSFHKVITYSTESNDADFTARNIRALPEGGTAFEIVGVGIIGRARLKAGCAEDVQDALAAATAAIAVGIPLAEILEALNRLEPSA